VTASDRQTQAIPLAGRPFHGVASRNILDRPAGWYEHQLRLQPFRRIPNALKFRLALGTERLAPVALLAGRRLIQMADDIKAKEIERDAAVMDASAVCAYLHISRATLYRMINRSKIPFFRIGYHYRFNREQIDEWRRVLEGR
jgi:excisionase family DNA binding protein